MIHQRQKLLNDLLVIFFAIFLFGSTFSIALAQIALGISLILFLVIAIGTRYNPFARELKWFYIFVGLYIFWMLLASLLGKTPVRSIFILKEEWLFFGVPIGIYLLAKESYREKLTLVFASGIGLLALYGIAQFFTGVHWFESVPPNPGPEFGWVVKGNFPGPMTYGNYFGTAGAFFAGYILTRGGDMGKNRKRLYTIVATIAVLATITSYNRGAILGLFVAFVVLSIVLRKSRIILGVAGAVALTIVVIVSAASVRERLHKHLLNELDARYEGGRVFIFKNSLKIIGEHPIFGVGQGNYRDEYAKLLRRDIPDIRKRVHAHNDFLNIAAVAGIPAMLFFLGIWASLFGYLRRKWRSSPKASVERSLVAAAVAGSIVFLVSSMTEATFADEEVRQMLMFVWAAGLFTLISGKGKSPGTLTSSERKTS